MVKKRKKGNFIALPRVCEKFKRNLYNMASIAKILYL